MAQDHDTPNDDNIHPVSKKFLWLASPKVVSGFIWLPVIGLVICFMAQFIYPFKKGHMAPWEIIPGSWAIIGFIAYTFVVLSADPIFKLLSRKEDYYGEGTGDE